MLEITGLTKIFNAGTINEKTALKDLSLSVADGDFITILGSNGAGKSTLFNAIAGNFRIDEGKIVLDGENITFQKEYQRSKYIGRLFQDPLKGTAPHMTIEENLALANLSASSHTDSFSRISKQDREMYAACLQQLDMGLEDRMDVPVGTLSGGQRQALTLLMATIVPPKLLLLDEHTAALDPKAAEKILALTKQIVEKNHMTCMMITHNLHQALQLGNRTIMMSNGRIISDLSAAEKKQSTVEDLMQKFRNDLDDDRILLREE
ncbi:MAG: ATP-binding cassette domain-containing protein [Solobacterium sp.]|jgi:putative ABC transport system ATP-binding protein|nr:ATP-binding cassette domain-containing protein [Solobacterium sp.]MCH4205355.1 ATP-binding cassette domain-containing protein [Solobacterium sp.]MCH4226948.1 ATP-binding cassette domain-containing protein [Solobacterium sp.]MCH4282260.1 ATP-binding cassette domain-containing protein [Solobacterium sp.]